jgi:hypothetical protein
VGIATIFYCLRLETSLFVASYDSQSYGGGIRPHLHTGVFPFSEVRVKATLGLPVYRQLVRLGAEPLETHGQNTLFSQLNACGHSPYTV